MEMSSPRQQEAKLAATFSKQAKQHIGARPAAQMILAFSAAVAMIPQIILGIWCMLVSPWVIAVAAIVEIQKHGAFRYTVRYTQHMRIFHGAKTKEKQ